MTPTTKRPRIMVVMGTRPEAIKLAPVVHELNARGHDFDTAVVATGQHRELLDQVLRVFDLRPAIDLELMTPSQSLTDLTSRALGRLDSVLRDMRPDLVVVQGDTTTVFVTALAAFYHHIPVAHVEAGLRSADKNNPFPEEINRRLASTLTDLHFAPTVGARDNLLREGVARDSIVVTGNTVVDAIAVELRLPVNWADTPVAHVPFDEQRVLFVTSHRRESWGSGLTNICMALADLVDAFPDVAVVYPVHPNPNVRETALRLLEGKPRVHLVPPLDYHVTLQVMRRSHFILTDSGGIQEEAPSLNKPVLILREVTERPEAAAAGLARIVGTDRATIVAEASRLLTDPQAYRAMATGCNPFGDGRAAVRIADAIARWAHGITPLLNPSDEFATPC